MDTHHTLCPGRSSEHNPLPTRVLDLEPSSDADICLYESQGEKAPYACLSHCWGGFQPLKTTLDPNTLSKFQREICWTDLPKTFQDAVAFARRLSIRYLWIDSLCIIQDNDDDWKTQSALMAEIYQNSLVTLAASASRGPNDGLFHNAKPTYISRELSSITQQPNHYFIYARSRLLHQKVLLPLMGRGWVFQERLLSPRFLHFGRDELIWECMECITCECKAMEGITERRMWLASKNRFLKRELETLSPRDVGYSWRRVIHDYSEMGLSKEKDVFPAISGVAKNMPPNMGLRYFAGLWEKWFVGDLFWTTRNPNAASRPSVWRAPTFSWASQLYVGGSGRNGSSGKRVLPFIRTLTAGSAGRERK
ncbi:HET-domain-containing protein [Zopfia rhizophila CBS 207.26]|uniref:HET-domain-containing protein n=1 Tax=Zopfia rhizophila CBS 207.26 TaxID=1314779 RepID=A0A6A6DWJ0_9PEZI|nr:HET-domain-containing protein [Zopfia rhizophila CBS 207.26]